MARRMRAIKLSAIGSTGQVIAAGPITLHGFILTEVGAAVGLLQVRTSAPNSQGQDVPATVSSPVLFERTLAASTDVPTMIDHEGVYLPGGLAITCTSTSAVTGVVLVS